jgi:chemotaxis protein methyltransferase CheR
MRKFAPSSPAGSMNSEAIATAEYEFISRLVYDQSRINLGPDKTELVSARVRKRLRALGLDDFESYCELLRSPAGKAELPSLLDVISTNVTDFFREQPHFDYLQSVVLPEWETHARHNQDKSFRAWSAACSSGEEPYSLAILFDDFFQRHPSITWSLLASDISTRVLKAAAEGVYLQDRIKLPRPEWLGTYFQKGLGKWDGYARVKSHIRKHVQFRHLNFVKWPQEGLEVYQVIFCRNVMIYFDRQTQEELTGRLASRLTPGGFLFVGHSESLLRLGHGLRSVRPSIYQKL